MEEKIKDMLFALLNDDEGVPYDGWVKLEEHVQELFDYDPPESIRNLIRGTRTINGRTFLYHQTVNQK